MSVAEKLENEPVNYRPRDISYQASVVLSKLKKGHTRREAFEALDEAHIINRSGKPIVASILYNALCYVKRANGKTFMETHFPKFVPTESPYPRAKMERPEGVVTAKPKKTKVSLEQILLGLNDTLSDFKESQTQLTLSVNGLREEFQTFAQNMKSPNGKKKDNAIHASIRDEKVDSDPVAA